jgi:hypothetical protein
MEDRRLFPAGAFLPPPPEGIPGLFSFDSMCDIIPLKSVKPQEKIISTEIISVNILFIEMDASDI